MKRVFLYLVAACIVYFIATVLAANKSEASNGMVTPEYIYAGIRSGVLKNVQANDILCYDTRNLSIIYGSLGRRELLISTFYTVGKNRVVEMKIATDTSRIESAIIESKTYENGRVISVAKIKKIKWKNYFGDYAWSSVVVDMYDIASRN